MKKSLEKKTSILFIILFSIIILTIVLCLTGLTQSIATNSFKYGENGIKYRLYRSSQDAEVIKSPNANGKITIPSYVMKGNKKYNVIAIKSGAFKNNNNIQEIYISEGVKIVEENSLPKNTLSKISVPNSIEVFEEYFGNNDDSKVEKTIFNGCKYLGNEENPYVVLVGTNPDYLQNLYLPDGLKVVGAYSLSNKNLINVTIPDTVTSIEEGAFESCTSLEYMNISEESNLKCIKRLAFNACVKLKELYISKNCNNIEGTFIGISADFMSSKEVYRSNLESIVVHPDNKVYDSREDCNAIIETKTNKLVVGCGNTKIPEGVIVLGEKSFEGVNFFGNELIFPNSLKKIEERACSYSNITNVKLNKDLEELEESIFSDCSELEELIINKDIKIIGKSICSGCDNLKKLAIPFIGRSADFIFIDTSQNSIAYFLGKYVDGMPSFSDYEINMPNLTIYICPKEKYTIRKGSIVGSFKEIYFLENVSAIQTGALKLEKIENIYIAKSVNKVGSNINVFSKISGKIYLESSNLGSKWNNNWNNMNAELEYDYDFDSIYSELENE